MSTASRTGPKIELLGILVALRRIHLGVSPEQRQNIYNSLQSGSRGSLEYASLVALAALIALFGLLQNSAAVIIGAMLISPMMNPLLAGALGLVLGDGSLGRRASLVLAGSVVGSIAITWFVAYLVPLNQVTPEILARTTPNLLDLFIAFLSGFAGTLALRGGPSSLMILPGVAIAVAVVPPLAVVGYGLSTRQFSIAAGAFLLFLTNLVAIVISAALVFRSMGFRPQRAAEGGRWKLKYRMAISAGVLLVLSVPLFLTLRRAVLQIRVRSEVSGQLDAAFRANGASVNNLSLSFAGRNLRVQATVSATQYLDTPQIETIEKSLRSRFGPDTTLQVEQVLVAVGGVKPPAPAPSQNVISGGIIRPIQQPSPFDFNTSEASLVQHLQTELDEILMGASIQRASPLRVQLGGTPNVVATADFISPEPIAPQTIQLLASQLSSKVRTPVQLNGLVDLSGSSYRCSFDAPSWSRMLAASNRRVLDQMIRAAHSSQSLSIEISYSLPPGAPAAQIPPLVRQLKSIFMAAHLKASQWSIQHASPSAAPTQSGAAASPNPVSLDGGQVAPSPGSAALQIHYDCQTLQSF
ncbi:MAG TPA: TIGR00341 family protein [Candidatus Dormibacteraeota bacterium]|nr:TIGR00341 family protein [Candidatus Dormibacteraeota bacterium]